MFRRLITQKILSYSQEYRHILDKRMVRPAFTEITDEELMQMSSKNPELRFERDANGNLITMPPTGGISGNREAAAISFLYVHVQGQNLGAVFSSSTRFRLANTAVRSPDAAFVAKGRLPDNWDQQEDNFISVVPDFVIEIRSKTDSLEGLKEKMQEYIENRVRLGWLIDRKNKTAYVYRADGSITQYPESATLSGEGIVPGFTLEDDCYCFEIASNGSVPSGLGVHPVIVLRCTSNGSECTIDNLTTSRWMISSTSA